MKKITIMVLMIMFCVYSVCIARIPQDQVAVGGIGYGASRSYVESIYGGPSSEKKGTDKNGKKIRYIVLYGKSLKVIYEDDRVIDIAICDNNSLATTAGVTCGMDLSVLKKAYGNADNVYSAHEGTIYVYAGYESNGNNQGVLEFDVRNNKIYQIEIW